MTKPQKFQKRAFAPIASAIWNMWSLIRFTDELKEILILKNVSSARDMYVWDQLLWEDAELYVQQQVWPVMVVEVHHWML